MLTQLGLDWRDHLILVRDCETAGEKSALFMRVRRGELIAIVRGAYVRADVWLASDADARYRARIKAVAAVSAGQLVLSHQSAAALWRLPSVGRWPGTVHTLAPSAAGGRSNRLITRHTVGVPEELVSIDGLAVTSLARTVVDIARTTAFVPALTMADAALRRTAHPHPLLPQTFLTLDDLRGELELVPRRQSAAKAARTIEFADGAADRPGESISRANIRLAGLTMPQLQVRMVGASGLVYFVDFWWPEFNLIGEFDGRGKYTDPAFLQGRTPQQALLDEKLREDDLRRTGKGMTRWPWEIAISMTRLRAHLMAAGVR
ncbi:MAG: hypothetical protein ABWX59_12930 [Microbacteriaceae bacterium]